MKRHWIALISALPFLATAIVLCSCGGPLWDVREEMVKLQSRDSLHRLIAAGHLGFLGHQAREAVPLLIRQLKREKDKVARSAMIRALRDIGDGRAVPVLKELGPDGVGALAGIAEKPIDEESGKKALDTLLEMALSEDNRVRSGAVCCLGRKAFATDDRVRETVAKAAEDSHPRTRYFAATSSPDVLGKQAVPLLKKLLKDKEGDIRLRASMELAKLGDDSGLGTLERTMFDKNVKHTTRSDCLYTLENLQGPKVIELLKRWVVEGNEYWPMAVDFLRAKGVKLPSWPPKKAREALIEEMRGKNATTSPPKDS